MCFIGKCLLLHKKAAFGGKGQAGYGISQVTERNYIATSHWIYVTITFSFSFFYPRPIHSLVMSMNTHPVRIALMMKSEPLLLKNAAKVEQILELMSDREFTNRHGVQNYLIFVMLSVF